MIDIVTFFIAGRSNQVENLLVHENNERTTPLYGIRWGTMRNWVAVRSCGKDRL